MERSSTDPGRHAGHVRPAGAPAAGRVGSVSRDEPRTARPLRERIARHVASVRGRIGSDEVRPRRPPPGDVLLALALGVTAAGAYAVTPLRDPLTPLATVELGWFLVAAIVVPLVWRRVHPARVMATTGLATGAFVLLGYEPGAATLGVVIALYTVSAYGTRSDGRVSLAITLGVIGASLTVGRWQGNPVGAVDIAVNLFVFVGIWALGDRSRARRELVAQLTSRAEEAERSQALAAGLAVADERARIARELHDVVAHTVSVVVVQAGAGRRVAERDPQRGAEVLAAIEASGREAMAELRRLVGVLRDDGHPAGARAPLPTLDEVPELVERLATTGVPVTLTMVGDRRPLPSGVEVSAYRIVQEALTNVLRHAGPVTRVEVTVAYGPDALAVRVRDDGRGAAAPSSNDGSGLIGMRERAALFGGRLAAGAHPEGGFEVRARLPVEAPAPDPIVVPRPADAAVGWP
jgi:signal transduction histidine kinase